MRYYIVFSTIDRSPKWLWENRKNTQEQSCQMLKNSNVLVMIVPKRDDEIVRELLGKICIEYTNLH